MAEFDLDVLICTAKQPERLNNLLCQIYTILNSGVNARATIAMDGKYPELVRNFSYEQLHRIRIIENAPQGNPSLPAKYCMENVDWSDWLMQVADDDILLPWGLKHLWDATPGVSMVIGQTIGVSRENHYDFSSWKIGHSIVPCHVSVALLHMRSLEKLPKPWLEIDGMSDYQMIKRMSEHFPHKIIPSVVHVQAFAELENLGEEFQRYFKILYGHTL